MFIRWTRYTTRAKMFYLRNYRQDDNRWTAILVESVRVDGKPCQRHVATLASFRDSGSRYEHLKFWDELTEKLNFLGNRLTPEQRRKIEAKIAEKFPCPSREQYLGWRQEIRAQYGDRPWMKPPVENWPALPR